MAAFDALTTAAVTAELESVLVGGRVQNLLQPDPASLGFEVYARYSRHYLLLCAHPQAARVHLVEERLRRGVEAPSPLALLLNKHAEGALIEGITCPPYERVIQIQFVHPEHGRHILIAEIMGRLSNLILVDHAGVVLNCLKRVGSDINRVRVTLPGHPYQPPPAQNKLSPDQITADVMALMLAQAAADKPLWRVLVEAIAGLSPQAARELVARAAEDAEASNRGFDTMELAARLTRELETLWEPQRSGAWASSLVRNEGGILAYAPYSLTHLGPATPTASISQAITLYYGQGQRLDGYAGVRAKIRGEIVTARAQVERQQAALQRQWVDPDEVQRMRQAGDWLLALATQIAPGQETLWVDIGEAQPLSITLDPRQSPTENAQEYFARYRKGQRAAEEIPQRLAAVVRDLAYLDQLTLELKLAGSQPEIVAVREALVAAGYLSPVTGGARAPRSAPPSGPIKVATAEGFTILVGRNSRQNEDLTFRLADAGDLWLHARGVPGAHVIVRCGSRPAPPAVIERAAELAAYYSAAREEAMVTVSVVARRRVRKQAGGHPGQVTFSGEETVRARPRAQV